MLAAFDELVAIACPGLAARASAAGGPRAGQRCRPAHRRGRRAARPDRGAAPRHARCARPRAMPAPAWSRRTRSRRAPATCSAGTSIFAMVVLERAARRTCTTSSTSSPRPPATRSRWCTATTARASSARGRASSASSRPPLGARRTRRRVRGAVPRRPLDGEADAGGLLAYNHLSGEPIAGLAEGRPLFVRTPDSRLTLANFMRAQLYGVFGDPEPRHARAREGGRRARRDVRARRHVPHRGRRPALPRGRARCSGRGRCRGGRGRRLGHRPARGLPPGGCDEVDLATFLDRRIFTDTVVTRVDPDPAEVAAFSAFLERYTAGLAVQRAAAEAL